MISRNQYFVTVKANQYEDSIALYETKKIIKPLNNREKIFELFEEIFRLGETEDIILYPIKFLRTLDAPKPGIERLITATARRFYSPSEDIVAIAVEYRLNGIFKEKGIGYLRSRIPDKKNLYFVGAFYKKFGESPCMIQVCIMTEKMWNEYCDSVNTEPESKDNSGDKKFSPLVPA